MGIHLFFRFFVMGHAFLLRNHTANPMARTAIGRITVTMAAQKVCCPAVTVNASTWSCFARIESETGFSAIQPTDAMNTAELPPETY